MVCPKPSTLEKQLGDGGRVLIRYSGTQAMCRVMVEAASEDEATRFCSQLADIVRKEIGDKKAPVFDEHRGIFCPLSRFAFVRNYRRLPNIRSSIKNRLIKSR